MLIVQETEMIVLYPLLHEMVSLPIHFVHVFFFNLQTVH